MTFDEIVKSISDEEFKKSLLRGQYEELKRRTPSKLMDEFMHKIEKEFADKSLT